MTELCIERADISRNLDDGGISEDSSISILLNIGHEKKACHFCEQAFFRAPLFRCGYLLMLHLYQPLSSWA